MIILHHPYQPAVLDSLVPRRDTFMLHSWSLTFLNQERTKTLALISFSIDREKKSTTEVM